MIKEFTNWLFNAGIAPQHATWAIEWLSLAGIALLSYLTTKIFKHLIIPIIQKITSKTKATWDDYIFNEKMLKHFCYMVPPIVWYILLPFVLTDSPYLLHLLLKASLIALVIASLQLINTFLFTIHEITSEHESLKNRPLKGIYQMINLVSIFIGIIIIISILIDKNAGSILAGLGASAAILMLIFKDSILGLVAGVQLSANDMLRPGDWITMSKYGADGTVIEVSLTTVKVQNFDKTITTIPPYILVSDSFQNWRGMQESKGRRIKRSINIDLTSIRLYTPDELERIEKAGLLEGIKYDKEKPVVNLYLLRQYILNYLKNHKRIHKTYALLVRQMQPTPEGLPLEIYCFTDTPVWPEYEAIQSEIFDYILAIIPMFGLRVYQRPAGSDLNSIPRV